MAIAKLTNTNMQCVRAIAILLVVTLHYRSVMPVSEFVLAKINALSLWAGVDIFFCVARLSHAVVDKLGDRP